MVGPEEILLIGGPFVAAWFAGAGYSVVTAPQPHFVRGRVYFILAALILAGIGIVSAGISNWSHAWRLGIAGGFSLVAGLLLQETLYWTTHQEDHHKRVAAGSS